MVRKHNIRLVGILISLIALIVLIEFTGNDKTNLAVNKNLFKLDPNKEINRVVLQGPQETNTFDFHDGRWHLNDSLLLDQSMRDVFFSVVSQLEVRRPVLETKTDSIAKFISKTGVHTTISFGEELIQEYWIGGNSEEQVSWAMSEDRQPYQVHIPGYQSYVAGIYSVPATDWRSRFLLDVNFALIRSISMAYPSSGNDLALKFEDGYFKVPGVQADSTKIANFLESLSFLQADSFVDPRAEPGAFVSAEVTPEAILKIQTLNGQELVVEIVSDTTDERFFIAKLEDGTLARIQRTRAAGLFKIAEDFE